ncbi:MAG TPA: helix-turn-helix transcriptional regulator [Candidatus Limnocylindrales bacterium]|nr:helix-turn-helix transcriptional regulator [Candidatus Limnocylindrales bacterium]
MRVRRALGSVLRRRREERGQSLVALAGRAACSPAFLSEIERGLKDVSVDRLVALAHALDLSAGDFYLELSRALGTTDAGAPRSWPADPRAQLRLAAQSLGPTALRSVVDFSVYLAATQAAPPRRRIGFTL